MHRSWRIWIVVMFGAVAIAGCLVPDESTENVNDPDRMGDREDDSLDTNTTDDAGGIDYTGVRDSWDKGAPTP